MKASKKGKEVNDVKDKDLDIKKILGDIKFLVSSNMSWKERKEIENKRVVSLGGKPPKKQRLPLSVALPRMKKKKEREEKMQLEKVYDGIPIGGALHKPARRTQELQKPKDKALNWSAGRFKNGVLDVKHLLEPTPPAFKDHSSHDNAQFHKKKRGDRKSAKRKRHGKRHHR